MENRTNIALLIRLEEEDAKSKAFVWGRWYGGRAYTSYSDFEHFNTYKEARVSFLSRSHGWDQENRYYEVGPDTSMEIYRTDPFKTSKPEPSHILKLNSNGLIRTETLKVNTRIKS